MVMVNAFLVDDAAVLLDTQENRAKNPSVPWSVAVTACSQEVHACVGQDLKGRNVMCMRIGAKSLTVADTGDVATKECVVVIEVGLETDVNCVRVRSQHVRTMVSV